MRIKIRFILILFWISLNLSYAQMIEADGSIRYGNEWIDHEKEYYKISVSKDGIYRLDYQKLIDAGLELSELKGSNIQLFEYGLEVPLFVSTEDLFGPNDYVLFYGRKNRGEIDKYLYENPDKQLNPEYSLFTDTLVYFLTLNSENENNRYQFQENDLSGNLPQAESYYWHEEKIINYSDHFKPIYNNEAKVTYSHLDIPEGFSSPMQKVNEYNLETENFLDIGEKARLKFKLAGSTSPHITEVSLDGKILDIIHGNGYDVTDHEIEINSADIIDNMLLRFEGKDESTSFTDRNSQSIISLEYPRSFSFNGQNQFSFIAKSSPTSKYFEFSDLDMTSQNAILFDLDNAYYLYPESGENHMLKFIIPPSEKDRHLLILNLESMPESVSITGGIQFVNYADIDKEYIILSHNSLREEFKGEDQLQAYADYRSSAQGGNHKTIIVDIEDIYDQFGYGVQRHSQSVNNFSNYIKEHWSNPRFFFIIGKGRDYVETRTDEQLKDSKNLFFVPTYGFHGSDVLLVAKKGENAPGIPVGRLAVKNSEQLWEYLMKVKDHENYLKYGQSLEEKEWMKKVIHLSGGSPEIQELLRNYLDEMGEVLSNNTFGANIVTYGRTSGSATETVTGKIIDDINDGAAIISFFGHSGVSNSDFNIGELSNEKHPLFLSLGCYSGDIHTNVTSGQSEKFVLSKHGVIAFIGSAGTAYITPQYLLGKDFYVKLGEELYGKSIGEAFMDILETYKNSTYLNAKSLNQQMTLHGDPAIKIHPHSSPDFILDYSSVRTDPPVVNSNEENFILNFDVVNLGRWVNDSLNIEVIREYPDSDTDTIEVKIAVPAYRQTVSLELSAGKSKGIGQNCIYLFIDPDNKFEEEIAPEAENNNELINEIGEAGYCFYIINNGAKVVYPYEFSIVNQEKVSLMASTYNYFVDRQNFMFQIDTTELFNSPQLLENKQEYPGGLLQWDPPMNLDEGVVYYWRVSPEPLESDLGPVWSESSFIYLPNSSEGWNQSHYFQYLKNEENGIYVDDKRKFQFDQWPREVKTYSAIYDSSNPQKNIVDGSSWGIISPNQFKPSLNIFAFTPNVIFKSDKDYGQMDFQEPYSFPFNTSSEGGRMGIKDLLNDIPDSSIVFVHFILDDENSNLHIEDWDQDQNNLFDLFESYGATDISLLKSRGNVPYIFIFKKGKGKLQELVGQNIHDEITATQTIHIRYKDGKLKSTLIGPVNKWNRVQWSETNKEEDDQSKIHIQFFDQNLEPSIEFTDLGELYDIAIDTIDSVENPYLQLEFEATDDPQKRTSPDLGFWRVIYESLPDLILQQDETSFFIGDTLNLGENLVFKASVFNNSPFQIDSLDVRFSIKKEDNSELEEYRKFGYLKAYDTLHISFSIPTFDFQGINEFSIEINPDKLPAEQHYFNNIGVRRFFVEADKENPILDVTFDGAHIKDGDIVSPNPKILMILRDENAVLLLNDPDVFKHIELIDPNGNAILIPGDSELLEFIPSTDGNENEARMIFRPHLELEGLYSLIVQAQDLSNNESGGHKYSVNFEVAFKEQIFDFYNYPNPFSNSTQFVFTISGTELPDQLSIQIVSVNGIIVKEITMDELGPLRIGNNVSASWNGRSDYGEKLATGVYFYKVSAKNSSGDDISILNKDSSYIKNGLGKILIL